MKEYFLYILTNHPNGVLYIGATNDLQKRLFEHKNNPHDSFSGRYKTFRLVYFEVFTSPIEAIKREKQLKNWHRDWKIKLIEDKNPNWNDLDMK